MRYHTVLLALVGALVVAAGAAADAKEAFTEAQAVALGRQIETAMNRKDPSVLDRAFDFDAMLDRAMSRYDVSQKLKDDFRRGAMTGLRKNSFASQVVTSMRNPAGYQFLRVQRGADGEPQLLFRLVTSDSGLNYHRMLLASTANGLRITDIYIYLLGEQLSDTFRRAFLPLAYDAQRGVLGKLLGWESDFVKNLPKLQKMQALAKEGKRSDALQLYFELPPTLQRDKTFLLMRTMFAAEVGNREYEDAMKAYQAAFPNDPSVDLVTLDGYVLNKRYGEAIKAVDRINASVAGDAYLAALRASLYLLDGKPALARQSAQKAVADDPKLADGYWALVAASLAEKNYPETARTLQLIERNLGVRLNDLKGNKQYAGFVQSPEYQTWMKTRPSR